MTPHLDGPASLPEVRRSARWMVTDYLSLSSCHHSDVWVFLLLQHVITRKAQCQKGTAGRKDVTATLLLCSALLPLLLYNKSEECLTDKCQSFFKLSSLWVDYGETSTLCVKHDNKRSCWQRSGHLISGDIAASCVNRKLTRMSDEIYCIWSS